MKALGLLCLAGCAAPAWTKESWLTEEFVNRVDAFFPRYRIHSRSADDLNRNLHWYAVVAGLENAGEEPLADPRYGDADVIRFTWYGAWLEFMIIRIERRDGGALLSCHVDGLAWIERGLSPAEWTSLRQGLDPLWDMPAKEGQVGPDGGWWGIEAKMDGRFWHAERWSPEGPFRAFCDAVVRAAAPLREPY